MYSPLSRQLLNNEYKLEAESVSPKEAAKIFNSRMNDFYRADSLTHSGDPLLLFDGPTFVDIRTREGHIRFESPNFCVHPCYLESGIELRQSRSAFPSQIWDYDSKRKIVARGWQRESHKNMRLELIVDDPNFPIGQVKIQIPTDAQIRYFVKSITP